MVFLCLGIVVQSTIAQEREFSFESKDETIERIISNLDARESFGGFRSLYYVYINDDVNKALLARNISLNEKEPLVESRDAFAPRKILDFSSGCGVWL